MCDVESLAGKILVGSISGVIVSISVYWMLRETWRMGREWISLDNLQLLLLLVYVAAIQLRSDWSTSTTSCQSVVQPCS
jgi:hypothetical protein